MPPISVAVLWHMHQPDYRDPATGRLALPWVRLHALKGYYDMICVLEHADEAARAVFNFVPILVRQLRGYLDGSLTDDYLEVSRKPTAELSPEERRFVVKNFFHANRRTMIDCYPRYAELRMLSRLPTGEVRELGEEDLRDLIVWFNLTWFGYAARREFPRIHELIRQGSGFSEEQKAEVLELQYRVMERVIPAYQQAERRGQIERAVTPFYHPILPLLCSTDAAKPGLPGRPLPEPPFSAPEDARVHVQRAIASFTEMFGHPPRGMWPAEGSVSPEAVRIFAEHRIEWVASDQEILFRSDPKRKPEDLYMPYRVGEEGATVSMVFRDRELSDAIGFRYAAMSSKAAVADFMGKLEAIRAMLGGGRRSALVTVILDGENPWEYYPDGGEAFLTGIYRAVARSEYFRWVTISEYLAEYPPTQHIERVFPGSWIGGNFDIWIGSDEENRAWSALRDAREALLAAQGALDPETRARAWEELYAAEGSDWFWWYGDDFSTPLQDEFDRLFRAHLAEVYRLIGQPVPLRLLKPIRRMRAVVGQRPTDLISPLIDGRPTNYYEWIGAGQFDALTAHGAMAREGQIVKTVFYGADHRRWYLRVDTTKPPRAPEMEGFSLVCEFPARAEMSLHIGPLKPDDPTLPVMLVEKGRPLPVEASACAETTIECAVPHMALGFAPGSTCEFVLLLMKGEEEMERWPRDGVFALDIPSDTYELDHWTV